MPQRTFPVPPALRWAFGVALVAGLIGLPWLYQRYNYVSTKRFRVMEAGKFYRSGRMTAAGLERVLKEHRIRTVINLMDEETDPDLPRTYFGAGTVKEKDVCQRCGAKMIYLFTDLTSRRQVGQRRPEAIDRFLEIMDDPKSYPVLLHCRAGLHRTGVLCSIYRMEYHGWSATRAWREMRQFGFGELNCYADNDYVMQYILTYEPGLRKGRQTVRGPGVPLDSLIRKTHVEPVASDGDISGQ